MMEKNIVFPKCIPSKASARHVGGRFDNPAKNLSPTAEKCLLKVRKPKKHIFSRWIFCPDMFFWTGRIQS